MKFAKHIFYGVSFVFCFPGCKDPEPMTQSDTAVTIDVQPFTDARKEQVDYVLQELKSYTRR